MGPDSLATVYNDSRVFVESLSPAYPDSVWVANIPQPSFADSLATWGVPLVSVALTAWVTYKITSRIYEQQKRDAQLEKHAAAFLLLLAICDEMRRNRRRVFQILEHFSTGDQMKGPLCLDAKESLIGRLTEMMPAWWEPHHLFRYYELLSLVAVHHNAAVAIPTSNSGLEQMIRLRQGDPSGVGDTLRQKAGYENGVAFAKFYYDTTDGNNLTDHYIETVHQLKRLATEIETSREDLPPIPTDQERIADRALIEKLKPKGKVEPQGDANPPGAQS